MVSFGEQAGKALAAHLAKRGQTGTAFLTQTGVPFTHRTLRDMLVRKLKAIGMRHLFPHLFRHTFATNILIDTEGDIFALQEMMGHKHLDSTRRYDNRDPKVIAKIQRKHSRGDRLKLP